MEGQSGFEYVSNWFELDQDSPYMLLVSNVKKSKLLNAESNKKKQSILSRLNQIRSIIPSVTHVDNSARIQTVDGEFNPIFFKLLTKYKKITNCPILVNTSFNVRGEPIVNTPSEAFNCFMGTKMDYLAIGNCILCKKEQTVEISEYHEEFDLD